ncbi:hypothetical protein H1R20_g8334, partial [Candolleomyces eurysporus]
MKAAKPAPFSTTSALTASFSSAITPILPDNRPQPVCEGWLLKKRRKKMQGFARRYFVLHHTGILEYAFEPGQPVRDHVSLYHAAVSTSPGRKDIHVDSNTATFHIKCLSVQDFDMWMAAFRKFISSGIEAKRSASIRIAARQGSVPLNRTNDIVDEMATTIASLDASFAELAQTLRAPPSLRDSSVSSRKSEKDRHREMFHLFKKQPRDEDAPSDPSPNGALCQSIENSINLLKSQHANLSKVLQASPLSEPNSAVSRVSMPNTVVEEGELPPLKSASPRMAYSPYKHAHRASYATSVSDSTHEWFDAEDGPEEFFVEINDHPTASGILDRQPSQATTLDASSTLGSADDSSSIDTDFGENQVAEVPPVDHGQRVYRTQLPVPCTEDEGSLFAILKKNVGKDLSTITFPVTFNEPLSLLQRAAEEVEYWELLNQAADTNDPVTRICYVAAFAVSGYAHTRHRSGRKGFNPMLAETFEDVRMKFIAEKVLHNPVEIAYHAEGNNWELTGLSAGRTKFWGKSLEIIPLGTSRLRIGNDLYVWTKPSSFMRNLMVGTKYFEHCGKMTIENVATGLRCTMDFKQNGYWGPTNVVSGIVHGTDGETLTKLEGKWDDAMAQTLDGDHLHVLWRCSPFPKNTHDYYGFTSFGITLNEITDDIAQRLPPTDSRLRSDVRALENGDLDTAEAEKARIEEMQRDRRRNGQERPPRWFKKVEDEWEYAGGYWESRSQGWKADPVQPLW